MTNIGSSALLEADRFLNYNPKAFLYTGAHAPALDVVERAINFGYEAKSQGLLGREILFAEEEKSRERIGQMVGLPSSAIAFIGDASTAWSSIAEGWEWAPGENIVVNEFEHPSVYYPWLKYKEKGLGIRFAKRQKDWSLPLESIQELCDDKTTAILISHVGYVTGYRTDLSALGKFASERGIPLLVDLSHSLGVVPIDLKYCSIAVSASYKWLMGPYGVGIVAWNREMFPKFVPGLVGWRSTQNIFNSRRFEEVTLSADARRFQIGAPALAEIAGIGAAAETILKLGIENISRHALAISSQAHDKLTQMGLNLLTPKSEEFRAGNIAFSHSRGEEFAHSLALDGIHVWGGDGRVRASFHVMNNLSDVNTFVDATKELLIKIPSGEI